MNKEKIQEKMEFAKECVKQETDFKKEAYTAILTAAILSEIPNHSLSQFQNLATHNAGPSNKPMSAKEFLLQKAPKSNIQKAICLAYYEEQHKGKKTWTVKDLVEAFKNAKETIPGNPSDVIFQCRGRGWVMENGGAYTLTNSGENQVIVGFSKEIEK